MMSHLTHVVIVAIMAATTQVTHAAPKLDMNKIDRGKFHVNKEMALLDRQEFWHGLENVTIHFGFHKDAQTVWKTMQNHTRELREVFTQLTVIREAAVERQHTLEKIIQGGGNTEDIEAMKQECQEAITTLTVKITTIQKLLQEQIDANKAAIQKVQSDLENEVDKLNTHINGNKEDSETTDRNHTKKIEALEKLVKQSNDSLTEKLDKARGNLSDTIQEKTDAINGRLDEFCDTDEEMNETVSEHTNMIITMKENIHVLEQKVIVLEKGKSDIDSRLHNLERILANVTYVLNKRHICPSGYTYTKAHDRCLMYVKTSLTQEDAEDECQKHFSRGHLAYVESKAVSDYLFEHRKTDIKDAKNRDIWIALHYDTQRSEWRWENAGLDFSSKNSWTNWDDKEPEEKTETTCVTLFRLTGKWRTKPCDDTMPAWCQATPARVDTLKTRQ